MQLIQNRLQRVDIYTPARVESGYIGTKRQPKLLGYVYADISPINSRLKDERGGKAEEESVKLILRPDAGVKCGDLAAIYSSSPNFEIREITRFSGHITARAVKL